MLIKDFTAQRNGSLKRDTLSKYNHKTNFKFYVEEKYQNLKHTLRLQRAQRNSRPHLLLLNL